MIDLRSDTVTKPTPAMRKAMAEAEVGDDVYHEDPTVNRLEERAAEIFEREAAIFVSSGCMGNQLALKMHTRPGTEVIIEERGHVFNFELAAMAVFSGTIARPVKSANGSGILTWDEVASAIHHKMAYYYAPTSLIVLENTHNLAGGTVMTQKQTDDICERAHALKLPVHLDGARIFNAAVALNDSVANLSRAADSVMFTLSKGLGAPVGSILLGSKEFIKEARTWRKLMGGGMRQIGILAAAGLIALEESPKRLHEDHDNARRLAKGLNEIEGVSADIEKVFTNILLCDISGTGYSASELCDHLVERGVKASPIGSEIRFVTHCDVSSSDIDTALGIIREAVKQN